MSEIEKESIVMHILTLVYFLSSITGGVYAGLYSYKKLKSMKISKLASILGSIVGFIVGYRLVGELEKFLIIRPINEIYDYFDGGLSFTFGKQPKKKRFSRKKIEVKKIEVEIRCHNKKCRKIMCTNDLCKFKNFNMH